jgi:arabinogalactan endo-1,4-beta-galactosidase
MRLTFLLFIVLCAGLISCKKASNGDEEMKPDTALIKNTSFERDKKETDTPLSWQTDYDTNADNVISGGYISNYCLIHKKNIDYKVYTYQTITNLPNGIYQLTAWIMNSGGENACYINAKNYGDGSEKKTSLPVTQSGWKQVIIRGINVTNGNLTIGLYTDGKAGTWCKIDEWGLMMDGVAYNFLKGGDVSELSYLESKGAKFFEDGVEKDCFQILKNKGFNIVRLRLYNDPGNPDYTPSNRLPAGFESPDDILNLASRAKAAGMQIQLTFHYSDYWTNGSLQTKPHEWATMTFTELKQAVYDFTYDFMNKMKQQNTVPEYVSLGNETTGGILFPDGDYNHFDQMAELFNSGYDAVKAVSPETTVIVHLDDAGNKAKYTWFFNSLTAAGGKYDMIGASYYPFWTQKKVEEITDWAESTSNSLGKKILIMETGYNWNPTLPDGSNGQLANNGPYTNTYRSSKEGQRDFLYECFNGFKLANNGCISGALYWDPIMIEIPGVGWELGAPNVVANTTLFDFSGNSLPSLKAFENN